LLLKTFKEQKAKSKETTIKQKIVKMEDNPYIMGRQLDEVNPSTLGLYMPNEPPSYYWTESRWEPSSGGLEHVPRVSGVGFSIYQKPIPMPRPAATMTRKGLRVYSPKKTKGGPFSLEVKRLLLATVERELPLFKDGDTEADLHVSITYRIRRPNDHYKSSNRLNVVKTNKLLARVTGGDIDNLAKYTLDSMNTLVYGDDKMITSLAVKKLWCEDPNSDGSTTVEVKNNLIF
jgi:Holliday junction resolvase RusA-like endonuclease